MFSPAVLKVCRRSGCPGLVHVGQVILSDDVLGLLVIECSLGCCVPRVKG